TARYVLGLEVPFRDRPPTASDAATIGMTDTCEGDRWQTIAQTRAWNWQQGNMLQWLPPEAERRIIYNARQGQRPVGVILDVFSGHERVLARPIYAVSPRGDYALSVSFARIADTLASGNLVVLRFLPAVAAGATVAVGAATVREMGGRRRSQIAGAGVLATGGFLMGTGHLLSTATFDLLAWIIVLWLTARMLRTRQPRWWIPIGLVAGVAMLNKSLVVMLGVAIVIGLAAARRWDLLRSPWIIAGLCSQPVSPCQISSGRHRTAGRSWR
ncbi:MAG: glycosyltransferase family 39 protein, partial [Actinomycetota bacterium]